MRDLIEYLMAILNIKTDSSFVVLDMQNELQDIIDILDYQKFIRKNINYLGMEYMTGFQKFIKLTEMYKRQYTEEHNKERLLGSQNTARSLSQKVKVVASTIEDMELEFRNIKNHFTEWELKELDKIGNATKCIRLQKSISGSDELYERLKSQMEKIVMQAVLAKPKEKQANLGLAKIVKRF